VRSPPRGQEIKGQEIRGQGQGLTVLQMYAKITPEIKKLTTKTYEVAN